MASIWKTFPSRWQTGFEPDVAFFIRYDLPWKSLYADEMQQQGCVKP